MSSRKEELERIIAEATAELKPLKQRDTYRVWSFHSLVEMKEAYGFSKEEILEILEEVFSAKPVEPVAERRLTDTQ